MNNLMPFYSCYCQCRHCLIFEVTPFKWYTLGMSIEILPAKKLYSHTNCSFYTFKLNVRSLLTLCLNPHSETVDLIQNCARCTSNRAIERMLGAQHHMNSFKDSIRFSNVCQKLRNLTTNTTSVFGCNKMLKFHSKKKKDRDFCQTLVCH